MISAAAIFAACDQLSVDEIEVVAPVIESFSPESAPVGAVVTITGKYLNNVTEAYIGSVKVDISQKVSDTRMSVKVVNGVTSGVIKLVNPAGNGVSSQTFNCSFAKPVITASLLQAEAEMGAEVLISGTGLSAVTSVLKATRPRFWSPATMKSWSRCLMWSRRTPASPWATSTAPARFTPLSPRLPPSR